MQPTYNTYDRLASSCITATSNIHNVMNDLLYHVDLLVVTSDGAPGRVFDFQDNSQPTELQVLQQYHLGHLIALYIHFVVYKQLELLLTDLLSLPTYFLPFCHMIHA